MRPYSYLTPLRQEEVLPGQIMSHRAETYHHFFFINSLYVLRLRSDSRCRRDVASKALKGLQTLTIIKAY